MHFLFVLADIRLEPQKIDLRFIEMLGENGILRIIFFLETQREKSVNGSGPHSPNEVGGTARHVRCPRRKRVPARRSSTSSANVCDRTDPCRHATGRNVPGYGMKTVPRREKFN